LARRIEDEFGHVQQLILIGKERGYLLYDEVNESLPAEVNSSQEIDDLLSALSTRELRSTRILPPQTQRVRLQMPRRIPNPTGRRNSLPKLTLTSASV